MNTNIDFKTLWKQHEADQPNMDDLLSKLKKCKNSGLKRIVITNMLLLATAVFIAFIWYYFQPKFISTKIGIVLAIMAMLIFLLAYNELFKFYKTASEAKSNSDYLNDLIAIKRKQKFLQTTMMQLYFILLSLGICLYLYEYVSLMPIFWGVTMYVLTLAWLVFNWIYIRPKVIKKQKAKLDVWIEIFERITRQLENE